MKKGLFCLLLFFVFSCSVEADLTDVQANDVAFFAENFILEGNKRIASDGFPIFAYMQGQARIDGFQSKLYKVKYDYQKINYVNGYKWTFDCSSFAAFVYYKTFGLVLTKNTTSQIDSYSGLKINSATANPYEVKDYVSNADSNKHFYYVMKGVNVPDIDYSKLKKGDLIVIVGSHIMVYVGDGKIAHASSSAINSSNLGLEVVKLSTKYPSKKVSVIRINNNIISPDKRANLTITWLDNDEVFDFRSLQYANDKPKIGYQKNTEEWTSKVILNVTLKDSDGLKNCSFNNGEEVKISGKSYQFKKTIENNGSYIVIVKDVLNNMTNEVIEINNIDNIAPLISSVLTEHNNDYSELKVIASDRESGLSVMPYSFDNKNTWTDQAIYTVTQSGEYYIYVRDNVGNISSLKVMVNVNDVVQSNNNNNNNLMNNNNENDDEDAGHDSNVEQELVPRIGKVTLGEEVGNKRKITVTIFNNSDGNKIIITKSNSQPNKDEMWEELNNGRYTIYLDEGTYYIWLKDKNANIIGPEEVKVILENQEEKNDLFKWEYVIIAGLIVGVVIFCLRIKFKK